MCSGAGSVAGFVVGLVVGLVVGGGGGNGAGLVVGSVVGLVVGGVVGFVVGLVVGGGGGGGGGSLPLGAVVGLVAGGGGGGPLGGAADRGVSSSGAPTTAAVASNAGKNFIVLLPDFILDSPSGLRCCPATTDYARPLSPAAQGHPKNLNLKRR
jgi:hypothetical protein